MSTVEFLRTFVNERLNAAAEEISTVISKTIIEYEEEIQRQRELLDLVLKPVIKLHRIDLPQHQVCVEKEEMKVSAEQHMFIQESFPCQDQKQPEPPQQQVCSKEEEMVVPVELHLVIQESFSCQDQNHTEPPQQQVCSKEEEMEIPVELHIVIQESFSCQDQNHTEPPQRQVSRKEEEMETPAEQHLVIQESFSCQHQNQVESSHQQICRKEDEMEVQNICTQENSSSQDQEHPEPPQVKEEQEKVCTSLTGLKQETEAFVQIPVNSKNDHDGPEPKICSGVEDKTRLEKPTNEFHHDSGEQQSSQCSGDDQLTDQDGVLHSDLTEISDVHQSMSVVDNLSDSDSQDDDDEEEDLDMSSQSRDGALSCQQTPTGVQKLLKSMRQDMVVSVMRNDMSILLFAESLYNKFGLEERASYVRQKLREVGRLLLCLRAKFSIKKLEVALKPANFQRVVQAVKKMSGFNEEKHSYAAPTLVMRLRDSLKKICDIIHCRALKAEDEDLIKSTLAFKKMLTSKWSKLMFHKKNDKSILTFTEDVQILHRYLEESAETASSHLKEAATNQNYAQLAKLTLARIIVFNRRRTGDVSKMLLQSFNERDDTELPEGVTMGLSKLEQKLCNYLTRVEITDKRGTKVAVLLTPSMVDALSLLTSKRTECEVSTKNVFLFARPLSNKSYSGQECLRFHANRCGAKKPERLWSPHLRKHVATLSQVLSLKNHELAQVADFQGHDIRVGQEFYELPVPTAQLAKIFKLLLSMEKGELSSMQGKSLDEIDIEDEMVLGDADAEDSESESDESSELTAAQHGQDPHLKNGPKKMWSRTETAAVMRHFKVHISKGRPATNAECTHCKVVEGPRLAHRTVQNIRDFVRNRGAATKRESKRKKLPSHGK